jgi:hypothetical protein
VPWIQLEPTVWDHAKTLGLADRLRLDPLYAAAHVAKLWTWALASAPDGELGQLSPAVIARAAGWRRDAAAFVEACVEVRFFDHRDDGALTLHGWAERMERWAAIQGQSPEDREEERRRRHAQHQAAYRDRRREAAGDRSVIGGAATGDGSCDGDMSDGEITGDRVSRTGPGDRTSPDRISPPLPPVGGEPPGPPLQGGDGRRRGRIARTGLIPILSEAGGHDWE